MKNLICILFFILSINVNAQQKFTTYDNTYDHKTYDIAINIGNEYKLYIDEMSMDHREGGVTVKEGQLPEFLSALNEAKLKYLEWVNTAKANNVKELDKRMNISSKVGSYFMYGDWNFQFVVSLKFDFKIIESEGKLLYLLIVRTGELQSSSNEYIKVDGYVLVFTSAHEIDSFCATISPQKIEEFITKPKAKDLFKD